MYLQSVETKNFPESGMLAFGVSSIRVLGVVDLVTRAGLILLPVRILFRNVQKDVIAFLVAELDEIGGSFPERIPREDVILRKPDAVEVGHDRVLFNVANDENTFSGVGKARRLHRDHLRLVRVPQHWVRREVFRCCDVRLKNWTKTFGELELLDPAKVQRSFSNNVDSLAFDDAAFVVKRSSQGRLHVRVDKDKIRGPEE